MNAIGDSERQSEAAPLADCKFEDQPNITLKRRKFRCYVASVIIIITGLILAVIMLSIKLIKDQNKPGPPIPPNPDIARLDEMLKTEPSGSAAVTQLWQKMIPLDQKMLLEYLDKAADSEKIDMWAGNVIYNEWTDDCAIDAHKCLGMQKNEKKFGIVRIEYNNGTVEEGTWYKENEKELATRWGLNRLIDSSSVLIRFYVQGNLKFKSTFDANFVELDRYYGYDNETLMQEIAPYKYSKEPIDKKVMLNLMLASRPVRSQLAKEGMWSRFIDLDLAWFENWWELPGEEMISWDEVEYDEWTSEETIVFDLEQRRVLVRNYGTRSKAVGSMQQAGLVRQVFNDYNDIGYFRQLCYTMEGRKNGISVGIVKSDELLLGILGQVFFHTPAEEGKAEVFFDYNFGEDGRQDPEGFLQTFETGDLKRDVADAVLKMLSTTPRYGNGLATLVWKSQVPIMDKLELGWERLNLDQKLGPILNTNQRFFDVWLDLENKYTLEGVRTIATVGRPFNKAHGITRLTDAENCIIEGYFKQQKDQFTNNGHWGLTRTISINGSTRIQLHGDDPETLEHKSLAEFTFDQNFVEDKTSSNQRYDPYGLIEDLTPEDFRAGHIQQSENEKNM